MFLIIAILLLNFLGSSVGTVFLGMSVCVECCLKVLLWFIVFVERIFKRVFVSVDMLRDEEAAFLMWRRGA